MIGWLKEILRKAELEDLIAALIGILITAVVLVPLTLVIFKVISIWFLSDIVKISLVAVALYLIYFALKTYLPERAYYEFGMILGLALVLLGSVATASYFGLFQAPLNQGIYVKVGDLGVVPENESFIVKLKVCLDEYSDPVDVLRIKVNIYDKEGYIAWTNEEDYKVGPIGPGACVDKDIEIPGLKSGEYALFVLVKDKEGNLLPFKNTFVEDKYFGFTVSTHVKKPVPTMAAKVLDVLPKVSTLLTTLALMYILI